MCGYKRNEVVKKGKNTKRPWKYQDRRLKALGLENRKCITKQMSWNRSQCLRQNCKKSAEWNGIYMKKSQMKTSTNSLTEENEVEAD